HPIIQLRTGRARRPRHFGHSLGCWSCVLRIFPLTPAEGTVPRRSISRSSIHNTHRYIRPAGCAPEELSVCSVPLCHSHCLASRAKVCAEPKKMELLPSPEGGIHHNHDSFCCYDTPH